VVPVAAFVAAHLLLVPHLLSSVSRATHGSPAWMTAAGWATAAFAPAAALVFLLDDQRRERQFDEDPIEGRRVSHGHAIAGHGAGHWIRRIPLILMLLVAGVFAPFGRVNGPVGWDITPGGDAFRRGWYASFIASLLALIALFVFWILALIPGGGARVLRVAGPLIAAAAPALALLALYASTH
jgi:hypothetical protein